MIIEEVMTREPQCAKTTATLREVASLMEKSDVGCIPIVEGNRLVGLITDRDLVVQGAAHGLDFSIHTAGEIMSTNLFVATPDMDVDEAEQMMTINKIRRLPVLDFGKLVGIVSLGDLAVETKDFSNLGHVLEEVSTPRGPKATL